MTRMLRAALVATGGLAAGAAAHINMVSPMPLQYKSNPYAQHIDYDIKSPLSPAQYPCHGALGEFAGRGGTPVEAWTPGQARTVRLEGAATHNGGSCQLSLSYDAGRTFIVLYSKVGGCPTGLELPFTLPADAPPADRALLAWTWNNHSGNREFYMNCASIQILAAPSAAASRDDDGSSRGRRRLKTKEQKGEKETEKPDERRRRRRRRRQQQQRQRSSSSSSSSPPRSPAHRHDGGGVPFASRPPMLVVNLFNTTGSACVAEGHDVLYPQPGPDYDDVSDAAALPFDCATGQTMPFGAGVPPVPSSVAPAVPTVATTSSGIWSAGPASTSSVPYEGETSASATATATSGGAPTGTGTSGGGGVLAGPCADEGVYNCIGGTAFQRCASGQWSAAEPVAPGTRCAPGLSNGPAISGARRRAEPAGPGSEGGR